MQIVYINTGELKPYKSNPRNNDNAVDAVAASISEFGFKVPIIIDNDNEIIAGHTRLKAACKLGLETVPCIIADDLTPDQIKAFRLADNKTAELAEWDFDLLSLELDDIQLDMTAFGFDDLVNSAGFENEIAEDDFDGEPPENPTCKNGDIWELGQHRLLCGDSTNAEDVERLMDGVKANMVFTDPPYGMGKEKDGVANDNLYGDKILEFNKKWIPISFNALNSVGSWYCWGIDEPLMDIYAEILKPIVALFSFILLMTELGSM